PSTSPEILRDRAWVIGETWSPTANLVNQFVYGETRANIDFPILFNGQGNNVPLNWFSGGIAVPFARQTSESRVDPIPTLRDDVTWSHSRHTFQFGFEWKPIRVRSEIGNAFNFISEGLGGNVTSLTPAERPANLLVDPTVDPNGIAAANWDGFFTGALGVLNEDQTAFIYGRSGDALPLGATARRDYRYYNYA